uniref:Uncharacterized protein n=1 Tax=Arundo donax TaxID=35708 RepID=A0A0A9B727_ARUDO
MREALLWGLCLHFLLNR